MKILKTISVEPVVFVAFFTMNLEVSVVQDLIFTKVCFRDLNTTDVDYCRSLKGDVRSELKAVATNWITAYNVTMALCTLVFIMWYGSWHDKVGRKRPMLLPFFGQSLSTLNFLVVSALYDNNVGFVILSALVVGITTGVSGVCSTCFAYLADRTTLESRSSRIALLEAMMFLGGACGFYTAGGLLKSVSFATIFGIEFVILVACVFYIIFLIENDETSFHHSDDVRDAASENSSLSSSQSQRSFILLSTSVIGISHIVQSWKTVMAKRDGCRIGYIIPLLLLACLMLFSGNAAITFLMYTFVTDTPISWNGTQYSIYHGCLVAAQGATLLVILPLLFRVMKLSDITAAFVGALSRFVGLIWLGCTTTSWQAYLTIAFLSFSEYATPSVRSLISKLVAPNEKGQVYGVMQALLSLAMVLGSLVFTGLYPLTAQFYKGFGFLMAGLLQVIPVVIFFYIGMKLPDKWEEAVAVEDVACDDSDLTDQTRILV